MPEQKYDQLIPVVNALKPLVQGRSLLGLVGDLGYGKTTLIASLFKEFGCDLTHSPTFSLVNKYTLNNGLKVYHIDLYRLKNSEDIDGSGFWDLFSDEEAFFVIEWIDRIDFELLPLNFKKIILKIEKQSENQRLYNLDILTS